MNWLINMYVYVNTYQYWQTPPRRKYRFLFLSIPPLYIKNKVGMNEELLSCLPTMKAFIKKRKWGWIDHTPRRAGSSVARQCLERNPHGSRRGGEESRNFRSKRTRQLLEWILCPSTTQSEVAGFFRDCMLTPYVSGRKKEWWWNDYDKQILLLLLCFYIDHPSFLLLCSLLLL